MDFSSDIGSWIWASRAGMPLDSNDVQESIQKHQAHGTFLWKSSAAKGGSDINPFLRNNASNVTAAIGGEFKPVKVWSADDSIPLAHGTLASFALLVLFPVGAIVIGVTELHRLIWIHAGIQITAYVVMFAAMGLGTHNRWLNMLDETWADPSVLGIHLAETRKAFNNKHPVIGMALIILFFFQAVDGLLHHSQFKKKQRRTTLTHVHIWTGRMAIVVGMINGG